MDVAVVGGGAVGLSTAFELAARDADVTLYERETLGSGSTTRAAGICYDAFADRLDADIAAESLRRFRELGVLTECPYVWLARDGDAANADAIREQVPRMREHGRNVSLVDPAALGERYPDLRTDDVAVAAIAREAGYVDTEAFASVLADRLADRGVEIHEHAPVELAGPRGLATPDGDRGFDAVVVAAGPATAPLVAAVGHSLALKPYRAQALVSTPVRTTLPVGYDATEHVYWRPCDGGVLVGDGAHEVDPSVAETDDWQRTADADFPANALERFAAVTRLDLTADRSWAGLCTATPDRDPLVGALEDGLFVAAGWHGHGFMRAPAMGRHLAEAVAGTGSDPLPSTFAPTRFDGDEEFDVVEGMTLSE